MADNGERGTRRAFVSDVGRVAAATMLPLGVVSAAEPVRPVAGTAAAAWDLSWLERLEGVTDRAVFDWPSLGSPADPSILDFAARYLDNCAAVYAPGTYNAVVVFNVRTQAVPVALNDALWERFSLGVEYSVKDPNTQQPAVRNPFWHRAPSTVPGYVVPTLGDFLARGAFCLVCDFALGHLARRLATKAGRAQEEVHAELRAGFQPQAYAVPSGIFGLARAQNAGCAFMRF